MTEINSDENFVKVPHRVMDYLMTAKLNMTQFRILHAVIRNTFGFHEEWNRFSLNYLSRMTGCSNPQVTRELGKLIENEILIECYRDNQRMLRVNPTLGLEGGNSPPLKGTNSLDSTATNSLDSEGTNSSDSHIKKKNKEKGTKEKLYIDFSKIDDMPFLKTYLNLYQEIKGKKHVRISEESFSFIQNQIDFLMGEGVTKEDWEEQARFYLEKETPKRNNGSIVYFLKRTFRSFDIGRYDQFDK